MVGQYPHPRECLQSVDWLTMTIRRSYVRSVAADQCDQYLQDNVVVGEPVFPWGLHGYQGWGCNGMRWGRRDMDDLIQLSGNTAGVLWDQYLPLADNVSRVDLAVTLKFPHRETNLIDDQYKALELRQEKEALARTYSRTQSLAGGYTLYVGSRSSAQFGRLYDKMAESAGVAHWVNCLRWEVEFKKPLAWDVAQELAHRKPGDEYIYRRVRQWFMDRDVHVPDLGFPGITKMEVPRKHLPDEKRLEWLRGQVRPTVHKLINRGRENDVLKALGLEREIVSRETV